MHDYHLFRSILFSLVFFCFTLSLFAQTSSTITGTVKDQAGAVVVGATVTAKQQETGLTRTTVTDTQGRYVFPEMRVGQYQLRTEMKGFQDLSTQGFHRRKGPWGKALEGILSLKNPSNKTVLRVHLNI